MMAIAKTLLHTDQIYGDRFEKVRMLDSLLFHGDARKVVSSSGKIPGKRCGGSYISASFKCQSHRGPGGKLTEEGKASARELAAKVRTQRGLKKSRLSQTERNDLKRLEKKHGKIRTQEEYFDVMEATGSSPTREVVHKVPGKSTYAVGSQTGSKFVWSGSDPASTADKARLNHYKNLEDQEKTGKLKRKKQSSHHSESTILGLKDAEKRYKDEIKTIKSKISEAKSRPGSGVQKYRFDLINMQDKLKEVQRSIKQVKSEQVRLGINRKGRSN